jgi:hypothetical protein
MIGAAIETTRPPPSSRGALDFEDIVAMRRQGLQLLANGDVAAARLVLQRAAEAGDAPAAFALGGAYDPQVLQQIGVRGLAGDAATAQALYDKAAEASKGRTIARFDATTVTMPESSARSRSSFADGSSPARSPFDASASRHVRVRHAAAPPAVQSHAHSRVARRGDDGARLRHELVELLDDLSPAFAYAPGPRW